MKKFIKSHGSICLFPEGAMTHPETIIKFRTGAFHLGYPIYPIVIRYESPMTDFDITNHALKLISQKKTVIYMDILGPYYPPFSKDDIENIRKDMAKVGNMLLSRVSSKDVSEKTN
jgi:1-acyl-sn-glycerol-3-phosphate acyltransferase